ncbi:MAG: hypothetical protein ACREMZ_14410 [Gemmatimonadales bacterium]
MTASAENTAPAGPMTATGSSDLARTAMAILVTMLLLIVALTGILVETTWRNPAGQVEALPPDPGSVARR